jgi:hypothetical protein
MEPIEVVGFYVHVAYICGKCTYICSLSMFVGQVMKQREEGTALDIYVNTMYIGV